MSDAQDDADAFIYLVSHDLRSSIRALNELPTWVEEDLIEAGLTPPEGVRNSIALMHRHTARLDQMLSDLLLYARVGRKQETAEVRFDTALAAVCANIPGADRFDVTTSFACPSARLGVRDAQMLLTALIDNVVKHAGANARRIMVSTEAAGGSLVLKVADDGSGISEEHFERAVLPMTTLRSRDEVEGSGMGLAITAKIAGFYHGTLALSASPHGRGLCVSVTLMPESSAKIA